MSQEAIIGMIYMFDNNRWWFSILLENGDKSR